MATVLPAVAVALVLMLVVVVMVMVLLLLHCKITLVVTQCVTHATLV